VDGMSWTQTALVLLSILAVAPLGLSISKARAGEQTRFYGADGRSMGTATISGNATTFYDADRRRIAEILGLVAGAVYVDEGRLKRTLRASVTGLHYRHGVPNLESNLDLEANLARSDAKNHFAEYRQ
jgi:hypothetical protein